MIQWIIISFGILTGTYASYTDFKRSVIKNWLILSILIAGILGHTYFIFIGVEPIYPVMKIFIEYFGLAFLLYWLEFVPSGDAKLLASLGFLIPLEFYYSINTLFPISNFLVNCFLPLAVFLAIYAVIKTDKKTVIKSLKTTLGPSRLGWLFFRIFSLSGIAGVLLSSLGIHDRFLLSGFIIVGLMTVLDRVPFNKKIVYLPFFAFTAWMSHNNIITYLYSSLSGFLIYGIFRILIMDLANDTFTYEVSIDNLKPGMVIADSIFKTKTKYKRRLLKSMTIFSPIRQLGRSRDIFEMKNEGLREKDLKQLQELKNKDKLDFDKVNVHKTLPFAFFILTGFILTVGLKGNVLAYIYWIILNI